MFLEGSRKRKQKSYDLLTMISESFQHSVFKLTKRMIEEEEFPKRFNETILVQLWKKKGLREDLNNHRYIHMKDWLPRLCEGLIMDKMKNDIIEGSTVHQIEGIPGHCSEEHLVSVKSIIQRCIDVNSGCLVQLVDIQKFFDSENLRGVMNSLHGAKVNMKAYRTWYKINQNTVISVITPSGISEKAEAGGIMAQGSGGAALASGLDIARGVHSYF